MLMDDYQRGASKTAVYPGRGRWGGLAYTTLGLTGEAGEMANKVKKIMRDRDGVLLEETRRQLIAELGDVQWYVAQIATELGVSMSMVAQQNLDKLASRAERDAIRGSGDDR